MPPRRPWEARRFAPPPPPRPGPRPHGASFPEYNGEHRHAGIAMLTPTDVHRGRARHRLEQRARTLRQAWHFPLSQWLRRITAILVMAALGAACAQPTSKFPTIDESLAEAEAHRQRISVINSRYTAVHRLHDVSFPIYRANVGFCGEEVHYAAGFKALKLNDFTGQWRDAASDALDLRDRPTVIHVVANSPAERGGLRKGDVIVRVQDYDTGTGKKATEDLIELIQRNRNEDLILHVIRGSDLRQISVDPVLICSLPVNYVEDNTVNAYTDGRKIYITKGMLNFLHSNDDLALVVGHEFAHIVRGHIKAKQRNRLGGILLGALITASTGVNITEDVADMGAAMFSQEFESEADYTGLYYTARAGFDIQRAPEIWRRMANEHPAGIHLAGSTHPSTAKRYLAIEATVQEINMKRANGLSLVPDELRGDDE